MSYHGDIAIGDTIDIQFTTVQSTGAPTTLAGTPVVSAYVGNSTTEITAGITLTVDLDSRTGLHNVRVVATTGNGYAAGTNVSLVITTGTVNSVSAVGYVVGSFSIENRRAKPTAGSIGDAAFDTTAGPIPSLGISDQGTAQSATATTLVLRAAATFADDTVIGSLLAVFGSTQGYWQYRFVTDYVLTTDTATVDTWTVTPSGTITYKVFGSGPASVSAPAPVNAIQFAGQTITAGAGVTIPSSIASPTNITAGTITTVTNLTNAPGAGDFTATMKTSIGTAVAASAVASVTGNVGGNVNGSVASVTTVNDKTGYRLSATGVDDIWDEVVESTFTARQYIRGLFSALLGKISGAATTTVAFRDVADTKDRITATVDADGNRTAVTRDLT